MNQEFITKISDLLNNKTPFVISTITKFIGSTPRKVDAKMITYLSHGKTEIFSTIGGGKLEKEVIDDAVSLISNGGHSYSKEYRLDDSNDMACGGRVEVFHELTQKRTDLYIFGAGHVALALSRTLDGGPFTMHLIDERSEWVYSEKAPDGVVRHHMMWDEFTEGANWCPDSTYVVIMTHDHKHDTSILGDVINRNVHYIGLMGSKNKWCGTQDQLRASGVTNALLEKITCPIGDKSLGKGPTEIAVGIAQQLLKLYHQ